MGFLENVFGNAGGESNGAYDYSDNIKCPICGKMTYWNKEIPAWQCPACDHLVIGEDLEFDDNGSVMEGSPGIDWHCDGCGKYMNDQPGFDGYGDRWTCTGCGYENDTTASNIRW